MHVATPAEIVAVQIVEPELVKVNVPDADDGDTVAVRVTVFPETTEDGEAERVLVEVTNW